MSPCTGPSAPEAPPRAPERKMTPMTRAGCCCGRISGGRSISTISRSITSPRSRWPRVSSPGWRRWPAGHNRRRVGIPPPDFIPVAERMGLIKPLTQYLVELAGRDAIAIGKTGVNLPVAVNVSMRNLLDPHFPEMMEGEIARTGQPAELLKLESTESAVMAEPGRVLESMKRLRSAGIRFSIDDFGTGYSSLAYLQRLPVEEIKIDRSFVGQKSSEAGSAAIVRATIELGGSLGLEVVAEGVEDERTWQALKRMGCSAAQGYVIGRPMPVGELEGWMTSWSDRMAISQAA